MNITKAQNLEYFEELNLQTLKVTLSDGSELIVPCDPVNRHYAEIMRQVEAGTLTIASADEETNV